MNHIETVSSAINLASELRADNKQLQAEVEALKAYSNLLRRAVMATREDHCDYIADLDMTGTELLTMSEAQCLARVQHDAIMEMDNSLASGITTYCRCGALNDVGNFIADYATKLLDTKPNTL